MEEEKFGQDRKVWWWWWYGGGGRKKEAKIASPCKNVYLTAVPVHCLLLVLSSLTRVWCLCSCDILFYVLCFSCFVPHSISSPLFFHVAFVCTTPRSNSLHKQLLWLVLSHTGAGELQFVTVQQNEINSKWADLSSPAPSDSYSGMNQKA